MTLDTAYTSAFGAGFLSFFSPCVLPLVPAWLSYMAGVSVENFRNGRVHGNSLRFSLLCTALSFIFGFSTIFVLLGASASFAAQLLRSWREPFMILSGLFIMAMGFNFLGILRISFFFREFRFLPQIRPATLIGAYSMGVGFAFGWTPCIGPVLSAVLSLAASRDTLYEGSFLLVLYSIGFAIPFLFSSLFSSFFVHFLNRARSYFGFFERVIGLLLILFGLVFILDRVSFFL